MDLDATFKELDEAYQKASARDGLLHKVQTIECDPLALMVHGMDLLTVEDLDTAMREIAKQRDARTPKAVLDNCRCVLCWTLASDLCKRCKLWAVCSTCQTALEGNCTQCLWADQEDAAKRIIASRSISFEEACTTAQ